MAVSPVGTFFIVFFVLLVVAAVGWVVFTQLRARRLGLPSPPLSSYIPFVRSSNQSSFGQSRSGGVRGWVSDRFQKIKNPRSAAGAYEPSAPGGNRGFGPLDPDDAWDTRVGHEPYGVGSYYPDDHELEDRSYHGRGPVPHSGSEYNMNLAGDGADETRGRNPTPRPNGNSNGFEASSNRLSAHNPFDDSAAALSNIGTRGVSPRPLDTHKAAASGPPRVAVHDSPTSIAERRSIFREDI